MLIRIRAGLGQQFHLRASLFRMTMANSREREADWPNDSAERTGKSGQGDQVSM
jgi:hypothetical protein